MCKLSDAVAEQLDEHTGRITRGTCRFGIESAAAGVNTRRKKNPS